MAKKAQKSAASPLESIVGISPTRAGELLSSLTDREHEVASLMATGEKNKNIAAKLGISTKTLDIHRANLKWKLKTRGPVDIARVVFAEALGKIVK
jgi:DNA-binding NarL/FixJ family response regulator